MEANIYVSMGLHVKQLFISSWFVPGDEMMDAAPGQ
jgi:hypothetical protein